jgi:hypothetical protein
MKAFLLMTLVFAATLQANAYTCQDQQTGAAAGSIGELPQGVNGETMWGYSYPGSSEYWTLMSVSSGDLYNADRMVQHGRQYVVGKIEMKSFYFQVTINNRKMVCE